MCGQLTFCPVNIALLNLQLTIHAAVLCAFTAQVLSPLQNLLHLTNCVRLVSLRVEIVWIARHL